MGWSGVVILAPMLCGVVRSIWGVTRPSVALQPLSSMAHLKACHHITAENAIPPKQKDSLKKLFEPHVESFNFFLEEGIPQAVSGLRKVLLKINDNSVYMWLDNVQVGVPRRDSNAELLPSECRELGLTYRASVHADIYRKFGRDGEPERLKQKLIGHIPIMVKSSHCHLRNMKPSELVEAHEEVQEMGGYFICNGNERLIRMLIAQRRNYPLAVKRNAFMKRGPTYTPFGTSIRCVRGDQTSQTLIAHYMSNGAVNIRIVIRKSEYFIPAAILLQSLVDTSDREIFEKIVCNNVSNSFLVDRVELLIREGRKFGVFGKPASLSYLGSHFRSILRLEEQDSDTEAGEFLIRQYVLVHLQTNEDKYNLMVFMLQKLYAFVQGKVREDNADAMTNQEILLPGHIFSVLFKDRLQDYLQGIESIHRRALSMDPAKVVLHDDYLRYLVDKNPINLSARIENFIATGNFTSMNMELSQVAGYTIVGEKLNYFRYLSHFRSVHRGAFFTTMKTTAVRKLLPESWGFLCPVHTPDGGPCGLLNHLAADAKVLSRAANPNMLVQHCYNLGVTPPSMARSHGDLPVVLDGCVIGFGAVELLKSVCGELRKLKVFGTAGMDPTTELALLSFSMGLCPYPGFYIFTGAGRIMRPVVNLKWKTVEYIGTLEQSCLAVAVRQEEIDPKFHSHCEIDPTRMLSVIASQTPFSDFNQSPRNMYQCQMGKQTMATPALSLPYRTDNKMYRILTPQTPIVRNKSYVDYNLDDYPQGTNAVVAVISYTGYDMEDAMIMNKSSYERGFGHGLIYKTEYIDLQSHRKYFAAPPEVQGGRSRGLDEDGFPPIGTQLSKGQAFYAYVDEETGRARITEYKSQEEAYVERIRRLSPSTAAITLRIARNPIIGDKFSSRHGQKGVMSQLWPQEDMPFTESGMTPDVIINPHAFPSRMTIGMLVESMAGKSGALHGLYQDGTPFRFNEEHRAVDFFGQQLKAAGYAYHGTETMYSGIYGNEMKCDIFFGVVYYQRLRHMVSDKYQVRSTGPINEITHQPVKGRKMGGGIRFGEMERDSLLAHGTAFTLQDRLLKSSDYTNLLVCSSCGAFIGAEAIDIKPTEASETMSVVSTNTEGEALLEDFHGHICRACGNKTESVVTVGAPYVFKYLIAELAAMNIKVSAKVQDES